MNTTFQGAYAIVILIISVDAVKVVRRASAEPRFTCEHDWSARCWCVLLRRAEKYCRTTVALSVYKCTPPDYHTRKTAETAPIQMPLVNSNQGALRCHISRQARNSEVRIENTAPPLFAVEPSLL